MVSIFLLFNSDLYFVNSPKKLIIEALKSWLYLLTEYEEFITALFVAILTNEGDQ